LEFYLDRTALRGTTTKRGVEMNRTLNLLVVAALALMLVPCSYANEWVPPDMIAKIDARPLQADPIGLTVTALNRGLGNPTNIKTSGKQGASPVVQRSSLDDWVPLDIIRTWVIPFDP
jgi:hypothetical protein